MRQDLFIISCHKSDPDISICLEIVLTKIVQFSSCYIANVKDVYLRILMKLFSFLLLPISMYIPVYMQILKCFQLCVVVSIIYLCEILNIIILYTYNMTSHCIEDKISVL